jgi:hypothetical protein
MSDTSIDQQQSGTGRRSRAKEGTRNLRATDKAAASEAGRALGSIVTPKKIAAVTANLAKVQTPGRPPQKDPLTLPCTCGAGSSTVVGDSHKTTCPRGRLLYQRAKIAAAKKAGQA